MSVVVRRWRPEGYQRLELPDGKSWRVPRRHEVGLRCEDGPNGPEAVAPDDYDPGRLHRWVPIT